MGLAKTAGVAAVAVGGTMAVMAGLDSMSSNDIRACGDKVKAVTSKVGKDILDSDLAKDIEGKINGTKYGKMFLKAAGKTEGAVSSGFDKLVDALADSKDEAVKTGQSMTGVLFGKLTDMVATGADFVSEHVPSAKDAGTKLGNAYLASRDKDLDQPTAEQSGPEIDI